MQNFGQFVQKLHFRRLSRIEGDPFQTFTMEFLETILKVVNSFLQEFHFGCITGF